LIHDMLPSPAAHSRRGAAIAIPIYHFDH